MKIFKKNLDAFSLLAALMLTLVGCDAKNEAVATDPDVLPEVVAVQKAFATADPSFRNPVNQTLDLVKAGKINPAAYTEAMPQLRTLAANPNMTADQKRVLEALIERLKSELRTR